MKTIHVIRTIPGPPEPIFDLLADHANYDRFPRISRSELIREGEPPPNGLGAFRRIKSWPATFEEEITHFERPSRLDYLIVKLNLPFEHEGGSIRLAPENDATRVEWRSTYRVPTPVIGGLQELAWQLTLNRGFRRVLAEVERIVS
jgi:Polyketide cyclase / dehydrase and lipid transport